MVGIIPITNNTRLPINSPNKPPPTINKNCLNVSSIISRRLYKNNTATHKPIVAIIPYDGNATYMYGKIRITSLHYCSTGSEHDQHPFGNCLGNALLKSSDLTYSLLPHDAPKQLS